jgi:tRNA nucleotidyltransferase (CCA-adding enzyme)
MINKEPIPSEVIKILETLQISGYPSYLVGGCVRDLLLGKEPKDFDICTKATPEEVKTIFSKVIDTGIKYGTVTVLQGTWAVEITTFRRSVHIFDGARTGNIEFGDSAAEDVGKRDFTINGLLFDGCQIIDYLDGLADLDRKIIRAIDSPGERFTEDALRMLRAVRFSCQLDFSIEPSTVEAITKNAALIANVARERIRDEMVKVLISGSPARGFRLLEETGLLRHFLPELHQCYGFDQHNPHHIHDVFEHIMTVLDATPAKLPIRLAALLHDIGKPPTFSLGENGIGHFYSHQLESYDLAKKILARLKFDNQMIEVVSILIKEHMSRYESPRKSTLKKLMNRVGVENIEDLIELQKADVKGSDPSHDIKFLQTTKETIAAIILEKEPLSIKDLAINGNDLMAMGIEPGVEMGRLLKELLNKVLNQPELNTREQLLKIVKEIEAKKICSLGF